MSQQYAGARTSTEGTISVADAAPDVPHRGPVLIFLIANAISQIGSILTFVALPWFVLQTSGSATRTGITAFFSTVPLVLAGFFGGSLVERLGFKRASVLSDLGSGIAVALIPALYHAGTLPFGMLLVLVFLRALVAAPGATARQSLLPDLIPHSGFASERVNAVNQAIFRASILLGAPLAGILIVLIGTANLLWFDAASFFLSALLIGIAVPANHHKRAANRTSRYWGELREGFTFIRRDRLIFAIIAAATVGNFLLNPIFGIAMPVYVRTELGNAAWLGVILAAFGAGSVAGTLLYGVIALRVSRFAAFLGGHIVMTAASAILITMPGVVTIVAIMIVIGLGIGPISPLVFIVLQERVPAELRGRVFGMFTALANASIPIAMATAGYVVDGLGLRPTFILVTGAMIALTASITLAPVFRDIETKTAPGH